MANKIRTYFAAEVEALLPLLHETYRCIGAYQKKRSARNQARLLDQLTQAGQALQFFKQVVQPKKQPYFDALLDEGLPLSDRIIALDTAVGVMHIEFAVERAYVHRETEALRRALRALEESRRTPEDEALAPAPAAQDGEFLARGLPASPGRASGKAVVIAKNSDYRLVHTGCILVAPMTRPELASHFDRVAGIVTDVGGALCHAAILARERGIPCVVGTGEATRQIRPRMLVEVDGTAGTVRRLR